jgi:hypothetical protein
MQDKATDHALVESPLEFLVSSVAFVLYGSALAPSPQHSSVSEHGAIRVIKVPQVRPELPPAPPVRDNAFNGSYGFESSTLSGFAMGVIFVIVLLLLWKVIERGCGRLNAWRGRRKSENDRKAGVKNKEAETKDTQHRCGRVRSTRVIEQAYGTRQRGGNSMCSLFRSELRMCGTSKDIRQTDFVDQDERNSLESQIGVKKSKHRGRTAAVDQRYAI